MKQTLSQLQFLITHPRAAWGEFARDRVLLNSLYLMASMAVMAVFGFGFWLLSARLYSAAEIGLASTLITSATTLSLFSLLGFDNVLVRYLPRAQHPGRVIDASLLLTSAASVVLSGAFLLALPVLSPSLHAVLGTPLRSLFFIVTMLLVTINTLTDSVFIGWQDAKYVLIADAGLSVVKVLLPIVLVALGAFGIFTGYAVSVALATIISLAVMAKRYHYVMKPRLHRATVHEVRSFSGATYLANLAGAVPMMVLPIITTNALGPEAAAYFNLAMTIATLLYVIPRSTANSLFAEGAKSEEAFGRQYMRTARQTALILLPATLALLAIGHELLEVFGSGYAAHSLLPLWILAVSAPALAFNAIATIALKIKDRLRPLVWVQMLATAAMVSAAQPMVKLWGVAGAAWSWTLGQLLLAGLLGALVWPMLRANRSQVPASGPKRVAGARPAGGAA
jgi:O-antigen/teichoic acid export membrane protein